MERSHHADPGANIVGPLCSATSNNASIAARHSSASCARIAALSCCGQDHDGM